MPPPTPPPHPPPVDPLAPGRLYDRAAKIGHRERELAPWAMKSAASRGRRHPEEEDDLRTPWERDRDRIVHSTAFRRLMYKTQVFVNWEGDHHRTRLSHSLEVAQVARSVGSALFLNEPLCEALALAHDLGHPPFGHRGEMALDPLLAGHGGFRHNAQVLRVVDLLERRSPDYPGLNLTREVRESLLKHEKDEDWPAEFRPRPRFPCLEAQVVDLADSTAYDVHDIEDGLRAGMFAEADIEAGAALWRGAREAVDLRHPGFLAGTTDAALRVKRITNELIKICINDLIQASRRALDAEEPRSPQDVRAAPRMMIGHSAVLAEEVAELAAFLDARFYHHPHLAALTAHAAAVLEALFRAYVARPEEMPIWYRWWVETVGRERAVCDYLAGMTDRFAELEYERLTGHVPAWQHRS
ncbi:MAG: deoxyguanosinetriphosphate triphosphohydrolase [Planctomycetota bacterium]